MVLHQMKEELKYVSMESGELLVINTGIEERLMLSVGNWDTAKMAVIVEQYDVLMIAFRRVNLLVF